MSRLNASIRNDHLRISLSEQQIDLKDLHQMRSEFMEYLKQADIADVVIVDLPGIQKLDSRIVRLIQSWNRMAASFGRTLRLNGVSRVLHDLQQHINRPHHRSVTPTATL
jgi:ABC-type transporter Mla MlaB component